MADIGSINFALEPNDDGDAAHLYFPHREHDTDGKDCWCKPTFYRVCNDCDDGCWKCDGGKNRITAEQAAVEDAPLLIVHN